jgi:hypothetical protein
MPTNNINVTLDTSSGTNRLSVTDNGGQNQVGANSAATTITWHLTGLLAQASFVAMSDPNPGFSWVQPGGPPSSNFDPATVGSNGNSLSVVDNHLNSTSNGTWVYMLRVNYGGVVISTTASAGVGGTVNDPVIINH